MVKIYDNNNNIIFCNEYNIIKNISLLIMLDII